MTRPPPRLHYSCLFHLNMEYSSIEEEERPRVIERCYWPLLATFEEAGIPFAVEAPAATLEIIRRLDPSWTLALAGLCRQGRCEFVGSGMSQIIGPLVPPAVNHWNQRLGREAYREILGLSPAVALVNEQAWSAGLVGHYLDAGYRAVIMEWENPATYHPDWPTAWKYLPARAAGSDGRNIPLLWNSSIAFQKFQRHAHGEITTDAYLNYLEGHLPQADDRRFLFIYGNDAEIFDFRPGRYRTEAGLTENSEWRRIGGLLARLRDDDRFLPLLPNRALDMTPSSPRPAALFLESAVQPIPVKKQPKYNILRWAVTGRDDLRINTACWRIYRQLSQAGNSDPDDWKKLCGLWTSDYRTHITKKRWQGFCLKLKDMEERFGTTGLLETGKKNTASRPGRKKIHLRRSGKLLIVTSPHLTATLDTKKGLALASVLVPALGPGPLIGTLPHGFYDDIDFAADFYSGHLVVETAGMPKTTDLAPAAVGLSWRDNGLVVSAVMDSALGPIKKEILFAADRPAFTQTCTVHWPRRPGGSLRFGHITLNPAAFEPASLFYRMGAGGDPLTLPLAAQDINHLTPRPPLLSASQGFPVQETGVLLGDREKHLRVQVDNRLAAATGHILCLRARPSFFTRLVLSAQETDDSSRPETDKPFDLNFSFQLEFFSGL